MWIIKRTKEFLIASLVVMLLSVTAIFGFGLNSSVDFSGGSLLEIVYDESKPTQTQVLDTLTTIGLTGSTVQEVNERGFIIKTESIADETKLQLDDALMYGGEHTYSEVRFKNLSPTISDELKNKSFVALIIVVLATIIFIGMAFSKVTEPVSSYKYGVVAIITLLHDVLVPTAIFAALGTVFLDYQMDVLFVTALLAILGLSINDTIVIFDRIRENLIRAKEKGHPITGDAFKKIVGVSLDQTFRRSFITSFCVVLVLAILFFFGGESTKPFALVLGLGQLAGTYSSLFLASPLLVWIESKQKPKPIVVEEITTP